MRSASAAPLLKDLVLVGGGHSHVTVLKRFAMKPLAGLRLTLIARDIHTPYSGMLPGYIAGHYDYDACHIDLGPLVRFASTRLIHSEASGLDLDNNQVLLPDRPPLRFDLLSINIGSQPPTVDIPGADQYTLKVKPIDQFLRGWETIVQRYIEHQGTFRLLICGGGASGVELTLCSQYRLQQLLRERGTQRTVPLEIHLVSTSSDILPTHNAKVRAIFNRVLAEREIIIHTNCTAVQVDPNCVHLSNKQSIASDAVLWATGASAPPWLQHCALDTAAEGFIRVNDCLQSLSHPQVFATGDIADVVNHPRPKSGVFAVRQGPPLAANLRRAAQSRPLKSFRPQKQFLSLISTGDQYAVASRSGWTAEGRWLWYWKDYIDRSFMDKFKHLPEMSVPVSAQPATGLASAETLHQLAKAPMRCGGCGAKIGSTVLQRALARIKIPDHDAVSLGMSAPDDAAAIRVPAGKLMVQSVDYFPALLGDPYLFGQIVTHHALGDIFAMGAQAQSALAIATLPYAAEALQEEQLFQLLAGTLAVLLQHGATLIGGHSGEGAELAFGLTVNGTVEAEKLLRKTGLQADDALILTKPLGVGTLFAADMQGKAKGRWIEQAIVGMLQSNHAAITILRRHGTRACTDITGFGVLGHLLEMLRPAGLNATLELDTLPVLDGALETTAAKIFSSLAPENLRLRRAITNHNRASEHPHYPLLFDPQTAGGLLAGLPSQNAMACLAELRDAGYRGTSVIGKMSEATDNTTGTVKLI